MTGVERYPYFEGAQMRVELMMTMDKQETKRSVMTIIDWFTQLGAFMALLLFFAETTFSWLEFDSLSNLLIRKLYFVQDKNQLAYGQKTATDEQAIEAFKSRRRVQEVTFLPKLKKYFHKNMWRLCKVRYKPTYNQRIERKGMKKLHRELNIVNIIKQIRFLQGAINFLTTR